MSSTLPPNDGINFESWIWHELYVFWGHTMHSACCPAIQRSFDLAFFPQRSYDGKLTDKFPKSQVYAEQWIAWKKQWMLAAKAALQTGAGGQFNSAYTLHPASALKQMDARFRSLLSGSDGTTGKSNGGP